MAGDRHATLGDGDRRRRDRRSAHGVASGGGDAVRGLHLLRVGPARDGGCQAVLPRADADPDRRAPPVRRRLLGWPVPLPESRELVRAHSGAQGRMPCDAARREGSPRLGDRGPEPRALLRAQASLPPHQGRGAGGSLHRAVRVRERPPGRRRRHGGDLGRDGAHGNGSGRPSWRRRGSRSRSSISAP